MHDPATNGGPDVPACEPLVPGAAISDVDAAAAGTVTLPPARAQDLPATDRLLRAPAVATLIAEHGHACVAEQVATVVSPGHIARCMRAAALELPGVVA